MLNLKSALVAITLITTSSVAIASEMDVRIENDTQYHVTTSGWNHIYGSWGDTNNNPVAKGDNVRVLDLDVGEPTGYTAEYDVYQRNGEYLGHCTFTIRGTSNSFSTSTLDASCGSPAIWIEKRYERAIMGNEGQYTIAIHADK